MHYQGGKSRIAKSIADILTKVGEKEKYNNNKSLDFISLFCGSCAIESKVDNFDKIICNDKHTYLIEMFKGLQNGYELPDEISKEQYMYIKKNKDLDKVLTGFVGFGCSFGGKWFGGYAKDKEGKRNYASESKRSVMKDMVGLKDVIFLNKDYKNVALSEHCVIYADPPYNNTTKYCNEDFNTDEFWEYARKVSVKHLMFISEQNAPNDFISVWEKPLRRTLAKDKQNYFMITEKLFIHSCNLEKYNSIFT